MGRGCQEPVPEVWEGVASKHPLTGIGLYNPDVYDRLARTRPRGVDQISLPRRVSFCNIDKIIQEVLVEGVSG